MFAATKKTRKELAGLHNGLHLAMDALIRERDHSKAETILRQVDAQMTNLINTMTTFSIR